MPAKKTTDKSDAVEVGDTASRKAAPKAVMVDPSKDYRKALLDELDEANPEFVHMYQHPDILDERADGHRRRLSEMRRKKQEVVKGEDGEPLTHVDDPVVRVPRELWDSQRELESAQNRQQVEAVVESERSTVFRTPKN